MPHTKRRVFATAMVTLFLALPSLVAARQGSEREFDNDARQIISAARTRHLEGLRLQSDVAIAAKLDEWRTAHPPEDGVAKPILRVTLLDESHFGGCVHRTYSVRSEAGRQYWRFTWRDGSRGWSLGELLVSDG